ncbi:hypothetical protein KAH94_04475 [bacterium]|nr:hypothetical protein [bacterium]
MKKDASLFCENEQIKFDIKQQYNQYYSVYRNKLLFNKERLFYLFSELSGGLDPGINSGLLKKEALEYFFKLLILSIVNLKLIRFYFIKKIIFFIKNLDDFSKIYSMNFDHLKYTEKIEKIFF